MQRGHQSYLLQSWIQDNLERGTSCFSVFVMILMQIRTARKHQTAINIIATIINHFEDDVLNRNGDLEASEHLPQCHHGH